MQNNHYQRRPAVRTEFVTELENVKLVYYLTTVSEFRDGVQVPVERVVADFNYDTGEGFSVPVTIKPEKFNPVAWSPELGESAQVAYPSRLRILRNNHGYFGYGQVMPGTMLTDAEQIAVQRVTGVAIEKIPFKRANRDYPDGTPKFIGRSRKFGGRPVIIEYGLSVEPGALIAVSLSERRNPRPGDHSLTGKPILSMQKDRPIGHTVKLETPTGLKHGVTEATSVSDFAVSRRDVSIYEILSSKKLGITITDGSRTDAIQNAVDRLSASADPVKAKEKFPNLPLNVEAQLCGFYDAIQAAGEIALRVAKEKFGDEPAPDAVQEGGRKRRRRHGRNREERNADGQATAESATSEDGSDTTATDAEAQAPATVETSDQNADTVRPPAPPVFEESEESEHVDLTAATHAAAPAIADERIVARATALKVDAAKLEQAFMNEVQKAGARGQMLSLEEFLAKGDSVIRFALRYASAK